MGEPAIYYRGGGWKISYRLKEFFFFTDQQGRYFFSRTAVHDIN